MKRRKAKKYIKRQYRLAALSNRQFINGFRGTPISEVELLDDVYGPWGLIWTTYGYDPLR